MAWNHLHHGGKRLRIDILFTYKEATQPAAVRAQQTTRRGGITALQLGGFAESQTLAYCAVQYFAVRSNQRRRRGIERRTHLELTSCKRASRVPRQAVEWGKRKEKTNCYSLGALGPRQPRETGSPRTLMQESNRRERCARLPLHHGSLPGQSPFPFQFLLVPS